MDDAPETLDGPSLAKRLGISSRTLRSWVVAGCIPAPPPRGHNTRYDRARIVIAHAVASLRRDGVPLPHIPRFLAKKTDAELREIGGLPAPRVPGPPPALPPNASAPQPPAEDASASGRTTVPTRLASSEGAEAFGGSAGGAPATRGGGRPPISRSSASVFLAR